MHVNIYIYIYIFVVVSTLVIFKCDQNQPLDFENPYLKSSKPIALLPFSSVTVFSGLFFLKKNFSPCYKKHLTTE
jgi:hypothetical protein